MTVKHVALGALAGFLAVAPGTAQAGFFDSLFGGSPFFQSPQPYVVQRRYARVPRRRRMIETDKPTPEQIAAIRATTVMTDRTLRDGDAVMTAQGIRVFEGAPAASHVAADFVRLDQLRRIPKAVRAELLAIDASRAAGNIRQQAEDTPATVGRSVAAQPDARTTVAKPVRAILP